MKPRIRVKVDGGVTIFLTENECSIERIREIYSGRTREDFEKELQELTKFPTVHFSTVEAALYAIAVSVFVVTSLYWAICGVSKL